MNKYIEGVLDEVAVRVLMVGSGGIRGGDVWVVGFFLFKSSIFARVWLWWNL